MLRWLALLLLIPLTDAILLVVVATTVLTAVQTVAVVVLTALVGMLLVRAEGRRTLRKLQGKLQRGEVPADELLDGGLLIAAGAFLLTPGLVTDAIGFLLVVPVTRIPIRMVLKKYVVVPRLDDRTGGFTTGKVYTFGFPDPDAEGTSGNGGGQGTRTGGTDADDPTYDLGEDAYDVDFDADEDR